MPHIVEVLYNVIFFYMCVMVAYKKVTPISSSTLNLNERIGESSYRWFFICAFLFSLFTFFGGDAARYKEFVESSYQDSYYMDFFAFEKFYIWLASKSMGSIEIWKSIVYGAALIASYITLKRTGLGNYYALLCFAFCALPSYGSTRGVLAYSTFLLGLTFLDIKKWKVMAAGVLLVLGSYFFHSSMVLPIVLLPFALCFELNKKRVYILLALFPIFVTLVAQVPDYIMGGGLDFASQSAYKYEQYVLQSEGGDIEYYGSFLTRVYDYFNLLFIPLAVWICLKNTFKYNVDTTTKLIIKISFYLAYVSLVIKFSGIVAADFFYGRYFTMVPFILYLAIPKALLSNGEVKWFKRILFLAFIKESLMWFMTLYYESFL